MPIETQGEWNARLVQCGCCPMPDWADPQLVAQGAHFYATAYGHAPALEGEFTLAAWIRYKVRTRTETGSYSYDYSDLVPPVIVEDSGTQGYEWVRVYTYGSFVGKGGNCLAFTAPSYTLACDGSGNSFTQNTTTVSGTITEGFEETITHVPQDPSAVGVSCRFTKTRFRRTYDTDEEEWVEETTITTRSEPTFLMDEEFVTETNIYSDSVGWEGWVALARAEGEAFFAALTEECWVSGTFSEYDSFPPASQASLGQMEMRRARYRFRVPVSHLGSWFGFTWDVLEVPEVGDPFFVSENNTYEWTGPGTGDFDDPSWLTPWYYLEPPDAPGIRKIVNIRHQAYPGIIFGARPKVMGEAYP